MNHITAGPKERTTEYVNRMAAAVRSTGWTKPIFYNISESPTYADAVVKANVDGISFQWYPTGLVANRTLKGNFLPHVDRIPYSFWDTIPAFKNKARMVYEFDAGDILQSIMYPAMARSFQNSRFSMGNAICLRSYGNSLCKYGIPNTLSKSCLYAFKSYQFIDCFKSFS